MAICEVPRDRTYISTNIYIFFVFAESTKFLPLIYNVLSATNSMHEVQWMALCLELQSSKFVNLNTKSILSGLKILL